MYYTPDTHIDVRPVEEWGGFAYDQTGQEHFVFQDPLVAPSPQVASTNDAIPAAFRYHMAVDLKEGFDVLEDAQDLWPNLEMTVVTSQAEYTRDLGTDEEFGNLRELINQSAMVFFGLTRSVRHLRARGIATDNTGKLVTPQGPYQEGYASRLGQALAPVAEANRVCIDPPALSLDPPEQAISTMRNMVEFVQAGYGDDDWETEAYPWLADLHQRDVLQSYSVARACAALHRRFGAAHAIRRALFIVPLEQRGIVHQFKAAGMQNVVEAHIGPTSEHDENVGDFELSVLERRGLSVAELENL
jgi:hypothetical protein